MNMKKEQLISIIEKLQKMKCVQEYGDIQESLKHIKNRVQDDEFKLGVVGEFSTGKSTFINAIIGQDILSHSIEETTATVTYIHNVPENDKRKGTCLINYRSGKTVNISSLSELGNYTTAQSQNHVAEKIASVEVFVHFLNVTHPITIIDTPGLNGIADNHREITINEIQKAHACIYLLPLRGVSQSDIDFLKTFCQYQSNFIFIQNFRDALKQEEGETPEQKIAEIKKILNEKMSDKDISIKYPEPICISALMALVSKDTTIPSLYEGDETLSSDDRKKLFQQSHFSEFEKCLTDLIESGKYKRIVLSSAQNALDKIVSYLIDLVNTDVSEMTELLKQDSKNIQNQMASEQIKKMRNSMPGNERKLENFVLARKTDCIKLCKDMIQEEFALVNQDVNNNVDKKLEKYENVEDFEKNNRKKISTYYSALCSSHAQNIKTKLDTKIDALLQQIYVTAILQAKRYQGLHTSVNTSDFQADLAVYSGELYSNLQFQSEQDKIKKKQNEVFSKRQEIKILERESKDSTKENIIWKQLSDEKTRHEQVKNSLQSQQKRIGKCPQRRTWTTTETREKTVYRGGIGILDKLLGPKTVYEDYTVHHDNSNEIAEWERKNRKFIEKKQLEEEQYQEKCTSLEQQLKNLENLKNKNKNQKERIQQQIKRLERDVEEMKKDYDFKVKRAKTELLNNTKRELKKRINEQFEIISYNTTNYMQSLFDINTDRIWALVKTTYQKFTEEHIRELENIISGNNEELSKKQQGNVDMLNSLRRIHADLIK